MIYLPIEMVIFGGDWLFRDKQNLQSQAVWLDCGKGYLHVSSGVGHALIYSQSI